MPDCIIIDCDEPGTDQITIDIWACDNHHYEALEAYRDWKEDVP